MHIRRFYKVCGDYSPQIIFGMVLSILSILPDIFSPLIMGKLTDYITHLTEDTRIYVWICASALIGNMLINSLLKYFVVKNEYAVSYLIGGRYVEMVSNRILMLTPAWFSKQKQGSIMSKVYLARYASQSLVSTAIYDHVGQACVIIGSMAGASLFYGLKAIPIVAAVCFSAFLSYWFDKKYSHGPTKETSALNHAYFGEISDPLACNTVVRDFGSQERESKLIRKATDIWTRGCIAQGNIRVVGTSLISLSNTLTFGGTVFFSVIGFLYGYFTVGDVVYINSLCLTLKGYVTTISKSARDTREALANLSEVESLFKSPTHHPTLTIAYKVSQRDLISFRYVGFSYPGTTKRVLNNVTFDIPKGSSVGIVGESGSGKTTLMRLLQQDYYPSAGAIFIGTDLLHEGRNHLFAHVQQDSLLFHRTILENICYPDDPNENPAIMKRVVNAVAMAGATDFIAGFKDGYDTIVGDRGVLLSGGQRQRITIARAFYNQSSIMILDEATANLDSLSEDTVQQALLNRPRFQTLIVIAHRLKTVRHLDQIVVLKDGHVVGIGDHITLLNTSPYYRTLCEKQNAL